MAEQLAKAALEALRCENALRRGLSPWNCAEPECPYVGQPTPVKGCWCFSDAKKAHEKRVRELLLTGASGG